MRVITGTARGVPLKAPKGMDTRPTMDQVKEGIFSAIQFEVEGRRALDLFAGSGQLGIEALSRGAESAVFVDVRKDAAALIRENLRKALEYGEKLEKAREDGEEERPDYDAKLEALIPVLRGELPVHIHAHRADDIATGVRIAKEFGLKMLALKRAETLKNCLGVSYVEHNVLNELPENDQIQAGDQLVCYGRYKDFQKFWKAL